MSKHELSQVPPILSPRFTKYVSILSLLVAALLLLKQPTTSDLPDILYHEPQRSTLPNTTEPQFMAQLVSDGSTRLVHAASITELANGNLFAAWFAGSREGAKDVKIHASTYHREEKRWGEVSSIATPKQTQADLQRYIKKVGNPVVYQAMDQRLWLFYVSVSIGGWATSNINVQMSADNGATWSKAKRLITSPFFSLSTLVKGTPFSYSDGSIALPVYHELAGKHGELLRISPTGDIISKSRITTGRGSLQPILMPIDGRSTLSLLRNANKHSEAHPRRVLLAKTDNAGKSWHGLRDTTIANPNSAVTGFVDTKGDMWVIGNDLPHGRGRLSLMQSQDKGESWKVKFRFEDKTGLDAIIVNKEEFERNSTVKVLQEEPSAPIEIIGSKQLHNSDAAAFAKNLGVKAKQRMCRKSGCKFQYDYPYVIHSKDGTYHLLYTWNGSYIKHIQFNDAWLESLQ